MGIRMPGLTYAKHVLLQPLFRSKKYSSDVPRGHFAIYVGEAEKRYIVPVSYLKNPLFQTLLHRSEEEYGFDHGMGGIRVPCKENAFLSLTSKIDVA